MRQHLQGICRDISSGIVDTRAIFHLTYICANHVIHMYKLYMKMAKKSMDNGLLAGLKSFDFPIIMAVLSGCSSQPIEVVIKYSDSYV